MFRPTPSHNGSKPVAFPSLKGTAEPAEIWKAPRFVREHFREELSLHDVANAVSLSPNYLSERFKDVTGVCFLSWVAALRVESACERLRQTNLRITEIAFEAEFQSLSQFKRSFRRFRGESAREFRLHLPHN
jgi:two-component system response regulator YesN